jgi:acetyl esterase/lipase
MVCHFDAHPKGYNFSSYQENANAALLPSEAVYRFTSFYNPPPADVRFSPLLATNFSDLPPAYIQVSGGDPLRDDGLAYAEALKGAG